MKTSSALLLGWILVIVGLLFAIVFFTLKGRNSAEPAPAVAPPKTPTVQPKPRQVEPRERRVTPPNPRSSATQPAPRKQTIEGVVRGTTGKGEPGVHVAIHPVPKAGAGAEGPGIDELRLVNSILGQAIPTEEFDVPRPLSNWQAPSAVGASDREIASATTKDDGTFVIDVPATTPDRSFRLTATKEGVGSAAMSDVAPGARVDLMLGAAARLVGDVVTQVDTRPVDGAHVVLSDGARRFAATTDGAGHFGIEGVLPGFYELTVSAKGMTPLYMEHFQVYARDTRPVKLVMPRGNTVRIRAMLQHPDDSAGRGRGQADEPVRDAQVVIYHEDMRAYLMGKTNQEGYVEFAGVPAGKYVANGIAAGAVSQDEVRFSVDASQLTTEATLEFEPAVMTEVSVADEDGRPLPDVDFYSANGDEAYDVLRSVEVGKTDRDGKIRFAFEFAGPRVAIFGFKPGYAVVRACPAMYDSGDPIRLVMKKAVSVHGRVATPDGKPIPNAQVTIEINSTPEEAPGIEEATLVVRTKSDGTYSFPYLPSVEGITVSAESDGMLAEEDQDIDIQAGKTDYAADFTIDLEGDAAAPPPAVAPRPPKPQDTPKDGQGGTPPK